LTPLVIVPQPKNPAQKVCIFNILKKYVYILFSEINIKAEYPHY